MVTTTDVRHAADWDRNWVIRPEEFDLWLADVQAEAWDEGREYEAELALRGWNGSPSDNPYREDV